MVPPDAFAPLPPELVPVLVLMTNHHLGNFCVSVPVLRRLAEHFHAGVDLAVDAGHGALAQLVDMPARVMPFRRTPRGLAAVGPVIAHLARLGCLARQRYGAVIDVGGGVRSTMLVGATLARRRVGFASFRRSGVYNLRVPEHPFRHTAERYAQILTCIGDPWPSGPPEPVRVRSTPELRGLVERALAAVGLDGPAPLAVMHAGAGKAYRLWPPERFAAVADALHERWGMRTCLIGAPAERPLMDGVRARMRRPETANCVHVPVAALVALFERAAVFVGNESGPMHLACMTDVPIVAVYGPTQESRWGPLRSDGVVALRGAACDPACRRGACAAGARCILETTVDDMLGAVARVRSEPVRVVAAV